MDTFDELIDSRLEEIMNNIPEGLESWPDAVQEEYFKQLSKTEQIKLWAELFKASKKIGHLIGELKSLSKPT